jgi:hypothetical protein
LETLTLKELQELIAATHESDADALLGADGSPINSLNPRERCNEIWKRICRERGLDFSSIQPTDPPSPRVFLASRITN